MADIIIADATETVEIVDLTVDVNCARANHPVTMTATEWMNRFIAGDEDKNNFTCNSPACLAL